MTNNNKYNFHSDAGHGWLEVPVSLIKKFGVGNQISPYSYIDIRNNLLFLEEDCDASTFISSVEKTGEKVEFNWIEHNGLCFIRQLKRFDFLCHILNRM